MADATETELAAAIDDDPYDVENYRVYGDWLEGNGDPRGRLIGMMILLERLTDRNKREHLMGKLAAYLDEHREAFFPAPYRRVEVTTLVRGHSGNMQWRYGFAHHVTAPGYEEGVAALGELLAHPSGRFVVELGAVLGTETQELAGMLRERCPRSLRALTLDVHAESDLAPLWPALARIHALSVEHTGLFPLALGDIRLPELRRLALDGRLSPLAPLLATPLPRLEEVRLALPDLRIADLRPLFERTDLPLTALRLHDNPFTDDLCRELPATPLGARLKLLDLPAGMMTDRGALTLADGLRALGRPPLDAINVPGNRLSRTGLAALRTVAIRVTD
ncbi:MAG: hypothetical protein KIT31_01010 [Deltaproteobacteria bacterium]|nr:hypothetical protein [Deltaproteobacteria bacterium]